MKLTFVFLWSFFVTTLCFGQTAITASILYNGSKASGTYMAYRARNNYNIPLNTLGKPLIFNCLI
ncbi:MAG: hypothetical protein HOO91_07735 [Bacteroidales bacterium]|nr:hypothetical protein [Bacteroidales bacterium]